MAYIDDLKNNIADLERELDDLYEQTSEEWLDVVDKIIVLEDELAELLERQNIELNAYSRGYDQGKMDGLHEAFCVLEEAKHIVRNKLKNTLC